jgi:PAS domain S-box-containing protein
MATVERIDRHRQVWLEAVLDTVSDAACCFTLDDRKIIFVNQAFTALFGYELGELRTVREWIDQSCVKPQQAETLTRTWSQYFETDSIVPIRSEQMELDIRCKDGTGRRLTRP